jgi:myo-inositol-1-phosphate synthase
MSEVRVAIIGVGNCANSFVQGLEYYKRADVPMQGLVRPDVGGYTVEEIKVVAAFDVVAGKVHADLARAMWAFPNDTYKFATIERTGVTVQRGPSLDGLGKYLSKIVEESSEDPIDVTQHLLDTKANVVLNYLPVGSQQAAEFYADAAMRAGCAFVNCMPVFLASNAEWEREFFRAGLPIIGDDIKSQVGATITHRVLASLFHDRGVKLERTYQLNIGGNGDFLNMLERERLESKKTSKTNAVISVAGTPISPHDVHIGPSDYVEWLGDRKIAYITMEGTGFGGAPMKLEVKLDVWDSPNSAGIVIDAVRCAKVAMDRGDRGAVEAASAYFMKSPPEQMDDDVALDALEAFLRGEYVEKEVA